MWLHLSLRGLLASFGDNVIAWIGLHMQRVYARRGSGMSLPPAHIAASRLSLQTWQRMTVKKHGKFIHAHLVISKKDRVQAKRETFAYGMPIGIASAVIQASLANPRPAIARLPQGAALPCWQALQCALYSLQTFG